MHAILPGHGICGARRSRRLARAQGAAARALGSPRDCRDPGGARCAASGTGAPPRPHTVQRVRVRSEEHTSELQSQSNLVCRLLLEKKKKTSTTLIITPYNTPKACRLQCR